MQSQSSLVERFVTFEIDDKSAQARTYPACWPWLNDCPIGCPLLSTQTCSESKLLPVTNVYAIIYQSSHAYGILNTVGMINQIFTHYQCPRSHCLLVLNSQEEKQKTNSSTSH